METRIRTRMIRRPMEEYKMLKSLEKMDFDLIKSFERGLEDLKEGRVKRVR